MTLINEMFLLKRMRNALKLIKTVFLIIFIYVASIEASEAQISTYKAQSIFIYNFGKYINFKNDKPTFSIGVWGKSDITDELKNNLKGKKVGDKDVEIKVLNSVGEAPTCSIIYLASSKSKDLATLLASVKGKGILIVTEDDLAMEGAGVSFYVAEEKLRFKINKSVLQQSGLQASQSLLGLATVL